MSEALMAVLSALIGAFILVPILLVVFFYIGLIILGLWFAIKMFIGIIKELL